MEELMTPANIAIPLMQIGVYAGLLVAVVKLMFKRITLLDERQDQHRISITADIKANQQAINESLKEFRQETQAAMKEFRQEMREGFISRQDCNVLMSQGKCQAETLKEISKFSEAYNRSVPEIQEQNARKADAFLAMEARLKTLTDELRESRANRTQSP